MSNVHRSNALTNQRMPISLTSRQSLIRSHLQRRRQRQLLTRQVNQVTSTTTSEMELMDSQNTIVISNDDPLEVSCIDLTEDDDVIEIQTSPRIEPILQEDTDEGEAPSTSTITLRNRNVIRNQSTPRPIVPPARTLRTSTPSVVTISQESDEELPELVLESTSPKKKRRKESTKDTSASSLLSCPICFDDFKEVKNSNRQIVSTICGHLFCDSCLKNCLESVKCCPNCRKKLKKNQFHPVYF